jgi:hypothetical protein
MVSTPSTYERVGDRSTIGSTSSLNCMHMEMNENELPRGPDQVDKKSYADQSACRGSGPHLTYLNDTHLDRGKNAHSKELRRRNPF